MKQGKPRHFVSSCDSSSIFEPSSLVLADKQQIYPMKQKRIRERHLDRNYKTEPGQINFFDSEAQTQILCLTDDPDILQALDEQDTELWRKNPK